MKKLLVLALACAVGWLAVTRHQASMPARGQHAAPLERSPPAADYACDGRTRCSQMTSCDEAKYFLAHCPVVKMDGDGDGIPCERQWCNGG